MIDSSYVNIIMIELKPILGTISEKCFMVRLGLHTPAAHSTLIRKETLNVSYRINALCSTLSFASNRWG